MAKQILIQILGINVARKICCQVESILTKVKLVILILPRLNTHSDKLKKHFWSLNYPKRKIRVRLELILVIRHGYQLTYIMQK